MIDVLRTLLKTQQLYIVVESNFTQHHIEKLMPTCKDRGRWKWIAETKSDTWEAMKKNPEARRSQIDGCDCFPRFYFNDEAFLMEFFSWCRAREIEIINIVAPKF